MSALAGKNFALALVPAVWRSEGMSLRHPQALAFSLLFIAGWIPVSVAAEDKWPEGHELAERSESPNGRYGVLLPTRENAPEEDQTENALVDLKTHRRIGVIRGSHYFSGQNHRGLHVHWAPDSSWCIVVYEARYGFGNITLVEPHGTTCSQADLGVHIQKSLDAVIARQAHNPSIDGYGSAYFHAAKGGKILVRATAFTNPKAFEDQPTYCAWFQGTFDLPDKKWTRSDCRKIVRGEDDELEAAYTDWLGEGITFNQEEDRLAWFDAKLNAVYQAVRKTLPEERFAAVKKEQVAWLPQLETRGTIAAKCEFMAARIKELRKLVW